MLKNLHRFSRKLAVPGVVVLAWTVMSHASTAQFVWTVGGKLTAFLDAHSWVGFLIGFLLLVAAVFWPSIRPHLPSLPATAHERIDEQRDSLSSLAGEMHASIVVVRELIDLHGKSIGDLQDARIKAIQERGELSAAIATIQSLKLPAIENQLADVTSRVRSAHDRIDEHRFWLQQVDANVTDLRSKNQPPSQ